MGSAYDLLNDYEHAVDTYLEALRMFREQKRAWETAYTLSNLGADYARLSQYAKSIQSSGPKWSSFRVRASVPAITTPSRPAP